MNKKTTSTRRRVKCSRRKAALAAKHRKARARVRGELRKKKNGRLGF